jgi:Histidine kinase-, DNA gyrase B-, and HSP90-like ATPase
VSEVTPNRTSFRTSRLLDFASEKELVAQIGHAKEARSVVILKELVDNAIDACEEAGIAPVVAVTLARNRISIEDNGPGIPGDVIQDVLDFSVRVSSREAYVSPTRGAQGNALKTIVAIPFVLDGHAGRTVIETRGQRHLIDLGVDRIRQQPTVEHRVEPGDVDVGTRVTVEWPEADSPKGQSCGLQPPNSYNSPPPTRGSTRISRSRSMGRPSRGRTVSGGARRPIRRGRSGSPRTRPRSTGTRQLTSSGWSPPTSPTIMTAARCAACASW